MFIGSVSFLLKELLKLIFIPYPQLHETFTLCLRTNAAWASLPPVVNDSSFVLKGCETQLFAECTELRWYIDFCDNFHMTVVNQHTHFYDLSNRDKLESDPVTPVFSLTVMFAHVGQCFINALEYLVVCQTERNWTWFHPCKAFARPNSDIFEYLSFIYFFLAWKAAGCKQKNGENIVK